MYLSHGIHVQSHRIEGVHPKVNPAPLDLIHLVFVTALDGHGGNDVTIPSIRQVSADSTLPQRGCVLVQGEEAFGATGEGEAVGVIGVELPEGVCLALCV